MHQANAVEVRINKINMMSSPILGFVYTNLRKFRLMRYLLTLCTLLFSMMGNIHSQTTVNKRLYLKSGSALSRTVPTAATAQTSVALFKSTVTVQSAASGGSGSFATSPSGSSTGSMTSSSSFTPSGSDRLMLVSVGSVKGANNAVSSVTFGGVALTKLGETVDASNRKLEMWYLVSPSTTAGTVTINWPSGQTLEAMVGVTVFQNVDQTDIFGPLASNSGSTASSSLTVTSAAGDIVVDAIAVKDNNITFPTGFTEIFRSGTNSVDVGSSYGSAASGAATTTSVSWTGISGSWAALGVAIKGKSNDISFTQSPTFCSPFTIKAGSTLTIRANATVSSGTLSGISTVPFFAHLTYGSTTVADISTASNSGLAASGTSGTLTWTTTLGSDVTITSGSALTLTLYNDYPSAQVQINFDGTSAISYVELPTTTYIDISSLGVYNAAYSGGSLITSSNVGATNYIRAEVTDPFGASDITGLGLVIGGASSVAASVVNTATCTKTYPRPEVPLLSRLRPRRVRKEL